MEKLLPFCRDITEFELEPFSDGIKFQMATLLWQE